VGTVAFLAAVPTGAIETGSFGLDVARGTPDGRLHIPVRAGRTTTGSVQLWNKTSAPIDLRLSVAPATVDATGAASMGGDAAPVAWVKTPSPVHLAADERRSVDIEVHGPRHRLAKSATVAIVAEPAAPPADAAVIERVALTTFLEPTSDKAPTVLGVLPWVAAALLVAVVLALRAARRRRRPAPGAP